MTTAQMENLRSSAYRSYLVRFWQSHEQGKWRASAQCVQTGNTLRFGDIEQLLAFLQSEITVSHREGAGEVGSGQGESAELPQSCTLATSHAV